MQKKINWKLKNNNEVILDKQDVFCEYYPGEELIFKDEEGLHKIDMIKGNYIRETDDYKMIIDIENQIGSFLFSTGEKCSFDVYANIEIKNNFIKLRYKIDEDKKTIIIDMKER